MTRNKFADMHPASIILWVIAGLAWFPISVYVNAQLYRQMWVWFVVPLGAPEIGAAHASGLALLVAYVTFKHEKPKDEDDEEPWKTLLKRYFTNAILWCIFLFFGWVVHSFM